MERIIYHKFKVNVLMMIYAQPKKIANAKNVEKAENQYRKSEKLNIYKS